MVPKVQKENLDLNDDDKIQKTTFILS